MELTVTDGDGPSRVRLVGRMDPHGTQKIKERFREETVGRDRSAIVDMSGVSFITSLGVGVLVECGDALQRAGHRLVIVCTKGLVTTVLAKTGVDRIFPIVETQQEALAIIESGA